MSRDKYGNTYETGHLVNRKKTADLHQGIVSDEDRRIE
jgi:hypothetical protein